MAIRSALLSACLACASAAPVLAQDDLARVVAEAEAYERGAGVPQDFQEAVSLYRQAADAGNPAGMHGLARAYADGRGVARDAAQALALFAQAAELGNPQHMVDYGRALESGLGLEPDLEAARSWYERAAETGYVPAVTSLGVMALEGRGMDRDPEQARTLFEQAAVAGDARAQNNLGLMYSRGEDVERSYAQAAHLFQAAAAQGLPEAMRNLSVLYANGHGVAVDEAMSAELLRQARMSEALALDAVLEAVGLGFDARMAAPDWTRPPSAAVTAAARAGDPIALYLSGYQLLLGAGVRADPLEGEARLRAAANRGLTSASLALGLAYVRGSNVPQDFEEAYYWLGRAALSQSREAMAVRDVLVTEMPPPALERAQDRLRQELGASN